MSRYADGFYIGGYLVLKFKERSVSTVNYSLGFYFASQ